MSQKLTWNPDQSEKQTLTWDPNKPQKPATELEGIVNRMRADNVPAERIASVIQTYKRQEYEKLKAESIYNNNTTKKSINSNATETNSKSTESTTTSEYVPYEGDQDDVSTDAVNTALNEYDKLRKSINQ